ncbi:MAG: hypothetical protein JNL19_12275 [Burkholderiales bacterium]|nr:hypothetical protein [Burkholderiales bacterium]
MRPLFRSDAGPQPIAWVWVLLLAALTAWAFVRTAAVTEDAFITFRVIDNALNGHGLTWNVGERVQPYTHPLWALLLLVVGAFTQEQFHTALSLSLALTITCVALIVRHATGRIVALWAAAALLFSEAFVEYSGAALENALAHALVAGLAVAWCRYAHTGSDDASRRRAAWMAALCAGLLVITRHDFAVLVAPVALALILQTRGSVRWGALALAALPLTVWTAFSLVYYGSPWPNSAYAKLNNGLSFDEAVRASEPYFRDLITYDAVTALVIAVAALRGLVQGRWRVRPLALGLVLYVAYLATAGGDYMGGRLFSVPFVLATTMLALKVTLRWWMTAPLWFAVTIALGVQHGWLVRDVYPHAEPRLMSQHAWLYPVTGWLSPSRHASFHNLPWAAQGLRARQEQHAVVAKCAVGLYGYNAGAGVKIVDPLAITDGFLARLPSKKPAWPGHYERALPAGYVETVVSGDNRLVDPALRDLYALTHRVATAPLWDEARWAAIWQLNTGADRERVRRARYDPNATWAPNLEKTSDAPLSCMGRLDPQLTVRLK